MTDRHSFNIKVAEKYGVHIAILLEYFCYWTSNNQKSGINFADGRYWTYDTREALRKKFPYLTERKMRTALDKMKEDGLILIGHHGDQLGDKTDRTTWYTVTQKGFELNAESVSKEIADEMNGNVKMQNDETSESKMTKRHDVYINNNISNDSYSLQTSSLHTNKSDVSAKEFETLWGKYPRKEGRKKALEAYQKALKDGVTYEEISAGLDRYLSFLEKNEVEPQFIRKGSKWFAEYSWEDEYVNYKKQLKPGEIDWDNV